MESLKLSDGGPNTYRRSKAPGTSVYLDAPLAPSPNAASVSRGFGVVISGAYCCSCHCLLSPSGLSKNKKTFSTMASRISECSNFKIWKSQTARSTPVPRVLLRGAYTSAASCVKLLSKESISGMFDSTNTTRRGGIGAFRRPPPSTYLFLPSTFANFLKNHLIFKKCICKIQ